MTQTNEVDNKTNMIDRALAQAKARRAAREAAETADGGAPVGEAGVDARPAISKSEDKARRAAAREAAKEARELERAARRAARAATTASKKPAHMTKVERAASRLPALVSEAQEAVERITSNFGADQITAVALHLQHHNRVAATKQALTVQVATGDQVTIVGGDPRFVGRTGTVAKTQRIRCFVSVPGVNKPVYCFTSDVKKVVA